MNALNRIDSPDTAFFFDALPRVPLFRSLADTDSYADVPADWFVGVADIVDSTREIAAGRYKTVNMVGAAVISAMVNALSPRAFPYIFGGDGAGFAVWPDARPAAERALSAVRAWARREFGMDLRTALVPVADIRAAGWRLRVARYRASDGVDYAMFGGGGMSWAEAQLKAGRYTLSPADPDAVPDLTGLSCRWSNLRARNGTILSVVIEPGPAADEAGFADLLRRVLAVEDRLDRAGHPVPAEGPGVAYPPPGLALEAQASHGHRSLFRRKLELLAENLFAWILFRSGLRLGRFDPDSYRAGVAANADFRKFDDGLKMTLDIDNRASAEIRAILEDAAAQGLARYGLAEQDEALVTCFVPSPMQGDHVHFIDGAGGGYARAAASIKGAGRA